MKIENGITYSSSNGGTLTLLETATDLENTGVDDGWPYFDDIYVNPGNNLTIDVNGEKTVSLETDSGESVLTFSIRSLVPRGTAGFKFTNLESNNWHRLFIDGKLAQTESNTAHGKTNKNGQIKFEDVIITND